MAIAVIQGSELVHGSALPLSNSGRYMKKSFEKRGVEDMQHHIRK